MSRVSEHFGSISKTLRGLPAWLRTEAIGQTLPFATPNEVEWLAVELLDLIASSEARAFSGRGFPSRLRAIASHVARQWRPSSTQTAMLARRIVAQAWPRLSAQVRSATAALGGWSEYAALLASDESHAVRTGAASFIVQAVEPPKWLLLAPLLNDSHAGVAAAAEDVLLELVARVNPHAGLDAMRASLGASAGRRPLEPQPFAAADVERVVLTALDTLASGERKATLVAMLALATPERVAANPALALWLATGDTPAHVAMKGFLRWTHLPIARERAWQWLTNPSFANAAADRLSRAAGVQDHECVLAASHLTLNPARAARLCALGVVRPGQLHRPKAEEREGSPWPVPSDLNELSIAARRGLPRFIEHTRPPAKTRDDLFAAAINEPDLLSRHACVRAMSPRGVLEFALDADALIARSAALRASGIGDDLDPSEDEERLWMRLRRSPHASVREIATQEFERFAAFDPATTRGMLRLRRRLAADRTGTIAMLRERLGVAPAELMAGLVLAIRRLGLQSELHTELSRVLSVPDARAVATAAAAMGEVAAGLLDDDRPLRATLGHADPRVRANAAGSLLHHAPNDGTLVELKSDPHHRVRSTAIRALLAARVGARGAAPMSTDAGDAFSALDAMLRDERAEHRLAGAWLGSRTPAQSMRQSQRRHLAAMLARLANHDDDDRVRRRARGALCVVGASEEANA